MLYCSWTDLVVIGLRFQMLLLTTLIMLSVMFGVPSMSLGETSNKGIQYPLEDTNISSEPFDELGDTLLFDEFTSAPLGFDNSIWNLYKINDPTLTWDDGEKQVLTSEPFMYTTLRSIVSTGPEVISEFNISYTGGFCYFGIGWADDFQDPNNNWISNLRESQDGVFIDYWDGQLFLVSCCDSQRTSTKIPFFDIEMEHQYRLSWSDTLVRLHIDNVELGVISRHIPSIELPFTITTSGQHYLVKRDQLVVDSVSIHNRELRESVRFPQILLIWPSNASTLYLFDEIDMEIEGETGVGLYSWNGNINSSFTSPWDIPVPPSLGEHHLNVYAHDGDDNWSSLYLMCTVVEHETIVSVYDSPTRPLIDGAVTQEESRSFTKFETRLIGEDRSEIAFDLIIGYHNDSLYIGAVTSLQDRYYSRISLLIDGEGSGVWGDAPQNSTEDILITLATPRTDLSYKEVVSHTGQEIQIPGLVNDWGVSDSGVSVEFLIPIACVEGNTTIGIGLGLIVSQGGFDSYFPIEYSALHTLLVIRSLGVNARSPYNGLLLFAALISVFAVLAVSTLLKPKKLTAQIDVTIPDEKFERIRTLLYSYPIISIERLALLANVDREFALSAINTMLLEDLIPSSMDVSETGVVRVLLASEKKQK